MQVLDTYISIKLNKKDKELLQQEASKNKLSTGSYCRFVLLSNIKEEKHAGFFS